MTPLILATLASVDKIQDYKIVDVNVDTKFAGRLGKRIMTDLVVEADGQRVTIHIQDVRHTRFQSATSTFKVGEFIALPNLDGKSSISLRPNQIKKS